MNSIDDFIYCLSQITLPEPNATNLYSGDDELSVVRRENLRIYLNRMQLLNPSVMIVGEAPGYNGCRLTGIPFTSEYILKNQVVPRIFEHDYGYKFQTGTKHQTEASATIVWTALSELRQQNCPMPLIWNIFPFHPYKTDERSNRPPTQREITIGVNILNHLLSLFNVNQIGAIGNKSYNALKNRIFVSPIRHPSYGGKNDFVSGINQLFTHPTHRS